MGTTAAEAAVPFNGIFLSCAGPNADGATALKSPDGAGGGAEERREAVASRDSGHSTGTPSLSVLLTIRLLMQGKEVGSIIGKRGEHVKQIRETSGAKVNISDGSCPERIVTIIGAPTAIHNAFSMIARKFEEDLQALPNSVPKPPITMRLIVPATQCGSLIGKGGSKIKEIREKTGASVQVATEMLPSSTERAVTISGTCEALTDCMLEICQILLDAPPKGSTLPFRPKPAYNPLLIASSAAAAAAAQQQATQHIAAAFLQQQQHHHQQQQHQQQQHQQQQHQSVVGQPPTSAAIFYPAGLSELAKLPAAVPQPPQAQAPAASNANAATIYDGQAALLAGRGYMPALGLMGATPFTSSDASYLNAIAAAGGFPSAALLQSNLLGMTAAANGTAGHDVVAASVVPSAASYVFPSMGGVPTTAATGAPLFTLPSGMLTLEQQQQQQQQQQAAALLRQQQQLLLYGQMQQSAGADSQTAAAAAAAMYSWQQQQLLQQQFIIQQQQLQLQSQQWPADVLQAYATPYAVNSSTLAGRAIMVNGIPTVPAAGAVKDVAEVADSTGGKLSAARHLTNNATAGGGSRSKRFSPY